MIRIGREIQCLPYAGFFPFRSPFCGQFGQEVIWVKPQPMKTERGLRVLWRWCRVKIGIEWCVPAYRLSGVLGRGTNG